MRLTITSPWTRNDNVKKVQVALKKHGWLQGTVDGVYGPDTARAVYRAKYWLGYRVPDQVAGDLLLGYLQGKEVTGAMKIRIARRKKLQTEKPNRLKMIEEARKWIGTKESPSGSNRVVFSTWYGLIGPWCAMFVTYCGCKTAVTSFLRGGRWAYVPYMVNDARAGKNLLAVTLDPKEGDIVTFDWDNDGIADHVGFFDHWLNDFRTKFATVEGNTGIGNDSNGGEVMNRERNKSDVVCFIHVGG